MSRKKLDEVDKKHKVNVSINQKLNKLVDEHIKETGDKKSRLIERLLKKYIKGKNHMKKLKIEIELDDGYKYVFVGFFNKLIKSSVNDDFIYYLEIDEETYTSLNKFGINTSFDNNKDMPILFSNISDEEIRKIQSRYPKTYYFERRIFTNAYQSYLDFELLLNKDLSHPLAYQDILDRVNNRMNSDHRIKKISLSYNSKEMEENIKTMTIIERAIKLNKYKSSKIEI